MKVLESTPTRLTLTMGWRWFNWSRCDFDRGTGKARIERVILFWPCKPIEVPLAEIQNVRAVSTTVGTEQGQTSEYPEVTFTSGRVVNLPCASLTGKAAKAAVEKMRVFLGFESPAKA